MERIKKRSIFLSFIVILLAAVSAALLFAVAPKRVNAEEEKAVPTVEKTKEEIRQEQDKEFLEFLEKADELAKVNRSAEITDYSGYRRITSGTITNICGKIIVFNFLEFSFRGVITDASSANRITTTRTPSNNIGVSIYSSDFAADASFGISEEENSVPFGENYVGVCFPNNVEAGYGDDIRTFDLTTMEFNISVSDNADKGVYWYELSDEEPTEPTEPTEPDTPTPTETVKPTTYKLPVSSDSVSSDIVVEISSGVALCAVVGVLLCVAILLFKKK